MANSPLNRAKSKKTKSSNSTFDRWLERDLENLASTSCFLMTVPLLAAFVASEFIADPYWQTRLWVGAWAIGGIWGCYVLYRFFAKSLRESRQQKADRERVKNGDELPSKCPGCGIELPSPAIMKLEEGEHFAGWHCDHCDTMSDRHGREIFLS